MPSAQCPILKQVLLNENMFRFYLLKRLRVFNSEDTAAKVQIINWY